MQIQKVRYLVDSLISRSAQASGERRPMRRLLWMVPPLKDRRAQVGGWCATLPATFSFLLSGFDTARKRPRWESHDPDETQPLSLFLFPEYARVFEYQIDELRKNVHGQVWVKVLYEDLLEQETNEIGSTSDRPFKRYETHASETMIP